MPTNRRRRRAPRADSPMLSTEYWNWLVGDKDISDCSESARWDFLFLETGLTDLTVDAFRDALYNGVLDGKLAVGDVKHKRGDGERLIAALNTTQ